MDVRTGWGGAVGARRHMQHHPLLHDFPLTVLRGEDIARQEDLNKLHRASQYYRWGPVIMHGRFPYQQQQQWAAAHLSSMHTMHPETTLHASFAQTGRHPRDCQGSRGSGGPADQGQEPA